MNNPPRLTFKLESNYTFKPYGSRYYGPTEYGGFPVHLSVPVALGRCKPGDAMEVRNQTGQGVPAFIRPLHLWSDGSVRAWEIWMPADLKQQEVQAFELVPGASKAPSGQPVRQPAAITVHVTFADGTTASHVVTFPATPAALPGAFLEEEQPFEIHRASQGVAFKGTLIRKSWSWYPAVELAVRIINYAPPAETEVKALWLEFGLPGTGKGKAEYMIRHATFAAHLMPRLFTSDKPFDVRVEGGAYVTDIRQLGREQTDYAVYERGPYAGAVDSWMGVQDAEGGWLLAVPEAVERNPKGWTIREHKVRLDLHPEWAKPLAWLRGMALYQRFWLVQTPRNATPEERENIALRCLRPSLVSVDSEAYRAAGWRIPFRFDPARYPRTELTIRHTWAFSWTYGTFEWGDQVGANKGSLPLLPGQSISQGVARNLEYDFVACAAKEFARTGLPDRWKQLRAAAEHMMHTDFVAVSDDPWKNGGIPHHCNRHTTGSSYPSHIWIEGLTLYYLMSGDRYALTVAQRVGEFFLKYIAERWMVVEATAREVGWTLVALAAIYDVTREERYLGGIKKVVDYCLAMDTKSFFPTDATFTIGVAVIGLDRCRPFYRDADIRALILRVLDHCIEKRCDATGTFEYNFDSEYRAFEWVQTHLPEGLAIGYRLSGDVKYLKAAWRMFQIHADGTPLTVQNKYQTDCGYAAGYHISWTMGSLADFAARGWLDRLQFEEL